MPVQSLINRFESTPNSRTSYLNAQAEQDPNIILKPNLFNPFKVNRNDNEPKVNSFKNKGLSRSNTISSPIKTRNINYTPKFGALYEHRPNSFKTNIVRQVATSDYTSTCSSSGSPLNITPCSSANSNLTNSGSSGLGSSGNDSSRSNSPDTADSGTNSPTQEITAVQNILIESPKIILKTSPQENISRYIRKDQGRRNRVVRSNTCALPFGQSRNIAIRPLSKVVDFTSKSNQNSPRDSIDLNHLNTTYNGTRFNPFSSSLQAKAITDDKCELEELEDIKDEKVLQRMVSIF